MCHRFQETATTDAFTQIVIPKSMYVIDVLRELHDWVGHLGIIMTTEQVKECSTGLGPLPLTERHNKCVLVVTDAFTKWVEPFPLQNTTADTLATCLVKEVCLYGAPGVIHSDQATNFSSDVVCSVCHLIFSGQEHQPTTPKERDK